MTRILKKILTGLVARGDLEVHCADGSNFRVGDGSGTAVSIKFADARAQWAFLLDPELRFGELFMDGRLRVNQGSIYELVCLLMINDRQAPDNPWLDIVDRLRFSLRRWKQRNDRGRSQRNVAHHYDLDAELYDLFLDADRQYSCAYFEHPEQSLEAAQLAKKRHIVAKLDTAPGQRVLDIGCGWGGMAVYLAKIAEAGHVLGVTLSQEQLKIAQHRAREQGLEGQVEFRLADYRELDDRYDRIVSVGMFEHVGLPYYDTFFQHCHRLLKDDGVMLLHSIGVSGPPAHADPWINKYIFPGGYVPALSEILPAIERAGLVVNDVEVMRMHYASTLRIWRERFMQQRERALALRGERFCLMWEFFLAFCEAAFRHETLVVFQLQLSRRADAVPLTRDYIARREDDLRRREPSGS